MAHPYAIITCTGKTLPLLPSNDFSHRPGKWNAKYYDYLFMQNYITSLQAHLPFHTTITTGAKQLT
jgi:hypothetical protein